MSSSVHLKGIPTFFKASHNVFHLAGPNVGSALASFVHAEAVNGTGLVNAELHNTFEDSILFLALSSGPILVPENLRVVLAIAGGGKIQNRATSVFSPGSHSWTNQMLARV